VQFNVFEFANEEKRGLTIVAKLRPNQTSATALPLLNFFNKIKL
jgi:hypothetical protein